MHSVRGDVANPLATGVMGALMQHSLKGRRDRCEVKALESLPGGEQQDAHCDSKWDDPAYSDATTADRILYSAVLALEHGTKVIMLPEGKHGPEKEVLLNPGDLLVFRGDCWHAGASYDSRNVRAHLYVTAPVYRRSRNASNEHFCILVVIC